MNEDVMAKLDVLIGMVQGIQAVTSSALRSLGSRNANVKRSGRADRPHGRAA